MGKRWTTQSMTKSFTCWLELGDLTTLLVAERVCYPYES
jgi:hypothetical protein